MITLVLTLALVDTSPRGAPSEWVVRVYDVRDLWLDSRPCPWLQDAPAEVIGDGDLAGLRELIMACTGGRTWNHLGPEITAANGLLIVRQRRRVHREMEALLAELRSR